MLIPILQNFQAPRHVNVIQGGGAKAEAMTVGRGVEDHDIGLSGLLDTFGGGVIVQIPWEVSDSFG